MYKITLFLLLQLVFISSYARGNKGWDVSGELPYSYAYARSWAGNKMRSAGWQCIRAFTSGKKNEIEHSIWRKDCQKLQMMLWRIDSDKTGYAQSSLSGKKTDKLL